MSYPKTIEECTECAIQCNTLLKEYYEQGREDGKKEMKARAEKAESELKAIKDRIEAIKELPTIENGQFIAECRWNAGYNTAIYDCKEIIKRIGGVK